MSNVLSGTDEVLTLVAPGEAAADPRLMLPLDEPGLRLIITIESARVVVRRERCRISPGKASQEIGQRAAGRPAGSIRKNPCRMRKWQYRLAAEYPRSERVPAALPAAQGHAA